jgi:signal transduction histidine kinase
MGGIVRKNGNALHVVCEPSIGTMHADATKVRQILFNLLSNAAKFTANGRVTVNVERVHAAEQEFIQFVVSDTGIGITAEQRQRLFQPFAQADASTARKYGGTGLGLALVVRFCKLMGGDVWADSPADGGSRFTVWLPASVRERDDAEAAGHCDSDPADAVGLGVAQPPLADPVPA